MSLYTTNIYARVKAVMQTIGRAEQFEGLHWHNECYLHRSVSMQSIRFLNLAQPDLK